MVQLRDVAIYIADVVQSDNPLVVFSLTESHCDNLGPLVGYENSRVLHSPDGFLADESRLGHRGDKIVKFLPVLLQCILSLDSRTTNLTDKDLEIKDLSKNCLN